MLFMEHLELSIKCATKHRNTYARSPLPNPAAPRTRWTRKPNRALQAADADLTETILCYCFSSHKEPGHPRSTGRTQIDTAIVAKRPESDCRQN